MGVDGVADFNALRSGKQVQFCAFHVLAVDGEDVRDIPLPMRKANLERLLRGRSDGIYNSSGVNRGRSALKASFCAPSELALSCRIVRSGI